jgi:hypothetical protein
MNTMLECHSVLHFIYAESILTKFTTSQHQNKPDSTNLQNVPKHKQNIPQNTILQSNCKKNSGKQLHQGYIKQPIIVLNTPI